MFSRVSSHQNGRNTHNETSKSRCRAAPERQRSLLGRDSVGAMERVAVVSTSGETLWMRGLNVRLGGCWVERSAEPGAVWQGCCEKNERIRVLTLSKGIVASERMGIRTGTLSGSARPEPHKRL